MTDTLKRPADDAPSADSPSPAKRPKPPAKEKHGGGKKKDAKGKGKARAALTPEPEPEPPAANANTVASSSSSTPQQNGVEHDDAVPESTNSIMNATPTITQSVPDADENAVIPNGDTNTDSMNVDTDLDPETTSNRLTSLLRAQTSGEPTSSARAAEREAEIARLSGLLTSHQSLLSSHQSALSTHQTLANSLAQSLTCQICLDLMYKPYALTPCGHVACYGCLVRWFVGGPMAGGGYSNGPANAVQREREAEDPVGWVVHGGWGLPGGPGSEPTSTSEPAPAASSSAPGTATSTAGTTASTSTAPSTSGSNTNAASGPPPPPIPPLPLLPQRQQRQRPLRRQRPSSPTSEPAARCVPNPEQGETHPCTLPKRPSQLWGGVCRSG
ncbi:hypothetical protein FA13DRAFT_219564 [Coprinellus micaceus]|uniref:RING-type domain-containing protein n=1 Tax=Coprinellus micaceus TaxID=71717 RepID=A0A4Y7TEQ7_COPMI|nr:hypothetical protein FA13DRAFT_219564 [Coprinellus micaceus]